jgi:hypothetical protein
MAQPGGADASAYRSTTFVRFARECRMTLWKFEHGSARGPSLHALTPHLERVALIVAAAASGLLVVRMVPPALVLPALGAVSFAFAGAVALFAYCSGADRKARAITPWDVAGVFALLWLAAGMLSEPEHVVQLFDQMMRTK